MKKLLFIFLIASYLQAQTWTGLGTKLSPYIIDTPQEFEDMGNPGYLGMDDGKYFKLAADLDFTGFGTFSTIDGDGTETWGNYLDGAGYTISNIDVVCGISIASGNQTQAGIWRGMRFSATTIDTLTPVLQNITFDGINLIGTGTIDGAQSITNVTYGVIAGTVLGRRSYYGGTADSNVMAVPLWDSVVVKNINFGNLTDQTFIKGQQHDDCIIGTAAYVGGWMRNVGVETDSFLIAFEDVTKSVETAATGAIGGPLFAISLWHTKLEGCYVEADFTMYETDNVNRTITIGGLVGAPRDYNTIFQDCYVQGNMSVIQSGGTAMTTRAGGLFGSHYAQGVGEYVEMNGCYYAGIVTTTSLDDPGLIWGNTAYGHEINNVFADTTISTLTDVYNTVTNAPAILATSGQTEAQVKQTTTLMQTQSTYELAYGYPFDFTSTWSISAGSYPTLQWTSATPPNSITISAPTNGSNQIYPITVNWSGVGGYDTVYIYTNDVLLDSVFTDTTYSITTGVNASLEIKVAQIGDATARDSVTVNALISGTLILDSAYAIGNTLYYEVRSADLFNADPQLRFFVGQDTINMTTVQTITAPNLYKDTTYSFTKPADFWSTGTVAYKVSTVEDSIDLYVTPDIQFLGQLGGTRICWDPQYELPIAVTGIRDLSCGWVSGIQRTVTVADLYLPADTLTPPYLLISESDCDSPYPFPFAPCTDAQRTIQTVDTTGGGSAVVATKLVDIPGYTKFGNAVDFWSIIIDGRKYFLSGEIIYMIDLVNSADTVALLDLGTYFDSNSMIDPQLWYFEYSTTVNDTIYHDGIIDSELPALPNPFIAIYETSGFQRLWLFETLPYPPTFGQLLSDTFIATESINAVRDYFRGIDPKFVREP